MLPRIRQDWTAGRILSLPKIRSKNDLNALPELQEKLLKSIDRLVHDLQIETLIRSMQIILIGE